jgi:hypothetical protein
MNQKGRIAMGVVLLLGVGIVPALPGRMEGPANASAYGPGASVLVDAGTGLVTSVDADTDTLVLDSGTGVQRIHVAHDAAIHDEHDNVLTLRQIRSGDAVSYELKSGAAVDLHVARQFWAIPSEG